MTAGNKMIEGMREAVALERMSSFAFVIESNAIEGINRVTTEEVEATENFIALKSLNIDDVKRVQAVYAPGYPIRDRIGMNVRVGNYTAPTGCRHVEIELMTLLQRLNKAKVGIYDNPWATHVAFERLHPFMDGNGRTGRALWAWHMNRIGLDPFALPFLHRFYYQTLENDPER